MGQISIPIANKVGYSMYWNSMWDNKINYSRSLKEDIFIRKFLPLIFEDTMSTKTLINFNLNPFNKESLINKYNIHYKQENFNRNNFIKHISDISKTNSFASKVWILKYQQWFIIYFFIYLPFFNKLKPKISKYKKLYNYEENLFNIYYTYLNTNFKFKYSFDFFNKQNIRAHF